MAYFNAEKIKTDAPKKKSRLGLFVTLTIIAAAAIGGAIYANSRYNILEIGAYSCYWDTSKASQFPGEQNQETKTVPITIPSGATAPQIASVLREAKIIDDSDYFSCYVKKTGAGSTIQAGYFEVLTPVSIEALVPQLQNAKIPVAKVTIPEGLRADEIGVLLDTELSKSNAIKQFNLNEFLTLIESEEILNKYPYLKGKKTAEGFLFPDTYNITKNATTKDVVILLLDTFQKKVIEANQPLFDSHDLDIYEAVTLGSIIEKETTRDYEEKQMVADILLRRLEDDWFLNVDATFLYEKKDWKYTITNQTKSENTPYNTYLRKGLTPTPIGNPGLNSIKAVLSPKGNDYWYYLHGNDGVIRYAKTYQEHQRNINNYLY
jgi:UPF0755 protein